MKALSETFTAFHGTGITFEQFLCPAYFTDNSSTALFFAKRCENTKDANKKPVIIECLLSFTNPLIVDLEGQSWGGFHLKDNELENECIKYAAAGDAEEEEYFHEEGLTTGFLAGYAESLGYDGLVMKNCFEEDSRTSTQFVVFQPGNIKIISSKDADREGVRE